MPTLYDSKAIIPAPFVSINKQYDKQGDGVLIGTRFSLNVTGKIVAFKGSPQSGTLVGGSWNNNFWTAGGYPPDETLNSTTYLKAILHKQESLRQLFSNQGLLFEIVPLDGSASMKCYPRVTSIDFPPGIWVNECDYTITLECDVLYGFPGGEDTAFVDAAGSPLYIDAVNETWALELGDQSEGPDYSQLHTFRLTHNVDAKGKTVYNGAGLISPAWQQARDWVTMHMSADSSFYIATSGFNLPSYMQACNHVRSENTDERGGSYSISESWIIASGTAFEDFTIDTRTSIDDPLTYVNVQGQVVGLEQSDSTLNITKSKYDNALAKFNQLTSGGTHNTIANRVLNYSGISNLHYTPTTSNINKDPIHGTINYSYEYNNRPQNCVPNSLSEVYSFTNTYPADVFARIGVIGRAAGPVLQDMKTVTENKISFTAEIVMPYNSGCFGSPTNVGVLLGQNPASTVYSNVITNIHTYLTNTYSQVFLESDTDSWTPRNGRYTRNTTWVVQNC